MFCANCGTRTTGGGGGGGGGGGMTSPKSTKFAMGSRCKKCGGKFLVLLFFSGIDIYVYVYVYFISFHFILLF